MNLTQKLQEKMEHEEKRFGALSAAGAMLQMDPHARHDLITYLRALNECEKAGDEEEQAYLFQAIQEVMEIKEVEDGPDLNGWIREGESSPEGKAAASELARETQRFFEAYQRCKIKSKLTTIRQIAKAAKLSATTVQAIEKQRVKPQFKTIKALAMAFKVQVKELAET
jgi:DNA-binding XRE family transcriptional regulator